MSEDTADRRALEALVIDNPDLQRLEALLDEFNIFEAAGWTRQEARHSAFLAFLLDPRQTHGLGDTFVKRFLQRVLQSADRAELPISPIELDLWSLDGLLVLREWQNIDILLLDEAHKLAVIIENKIDTGEHDDQLSRYWTTVSNQHPGWHRLGILLSPGGEPASHTGYIACDYEQVEQTVAEIAGSLSSSLGTDVRMALTHYSRILRRHIVGEPDIAEFCARLYQEHRRALDLIYQYRLDPQAQVAALLQSLIEESQELALDQFSKTNIFYYPTEWEGRLPLRSSGWTRSGRILLFEFYNPPDRLALNLMLGPGPADLRQRILDAFVESTEFKPRWTKLRAKWNQLASYTFLTKESLEFMETEQLAEEIRRRWTGFVSHDLPRVNTVVRGLIEDTHNAASIPVA